MDSHVKDFYETVPVGVCVLRRDRRQSLNVLYANPVFRRLMLTSVDRDIDGVPLESAWPGKDTTQLVRRLRSTTPPHSHTMRVGGDENGPERWIALTIAERIFNGEPCFTLWATDISASKEAEARLQKQVAEADAAAEMKSNFLATMSHEIRTPMQAIYGLLELIAEEKPDERTLSMINIARGSASGLLEILDDVLDMAKIDADKMEFDMFEVPVRTLVGGILEAMAIKLRSKDIKLTGEIDPDVPFVVIGDPKRLRQILMNLTGNALKFTFEGSVIVRVTTQCKVLQSTGHGVNLRFEVLDSGIGMSDQVCRNLFTPFTQADNTTSRKFGGTGLGLSICKKLVQHMGGQIGVESVEGRGSTFWFEIPTEEVGLHDSTVILPVLDGVSVLSVEDHPQGAREIKRSLESMGATVESCPTVAEGLELARRRPFDVGVIDQGLPDGLGVDLIRELIRIRPFMGLVMYTARDDMGLQHSLNSLGVQYLPKPASRVGLGEAVKDATRKNSAFDHTGPKRLLIAEDTASVRDILRRQLEKLAVEADFVENGVEALRALETGRYGILFTDLHMPELDGYGLAATIRDREQANGANRLPIVVLTADVQLAHRHIYLGHGFDECLLKPVSLGQFQRLLGRWGLIDPDGERKEPEVAAAAIADAVDRAAVRRQMGALDANAVEMMNMFIDMTAPMIFRLNDVRHDTRQLEEIGHSLKGAARSACCPALGDLAERLQDDAAKGQDCALLIQRLGQEFGRVRQAVALLRPD